ncbi:ABC transporter permease [Leptospira sp. 'Mane']|uniref:ABC transporter permease n=1 Tax=Leptospira sp. 'Mane' TaxID=3387407 RepID=UPI00398AB6BC
MIVLSIFKRGLIQEFRSPLNLSLTIFTTPFFILFYWILIGNSRQETIGLFVDRPVISTVHEEQTELNSISNKLKSLESKDIRIVPIRNQKELDRKLKEREIILGIKVYMETKLAKKQPSILKTEIYTSDNTIKNQYLSLLIKSNLLDLFSTETELPFSIRIKNNSQFQIRSDFEQFIPGLLVFSILMLVFSSSMMMTSEIESETYIRYKMSNTSIFSVLAGLSLLQLFNGTLSLIFSLLLAKLLGYEFYDKLIWVCLICSIGAVSCIGIGLLIARFMKTAQQAFLTSSFIMFLFLLFSGVIFPKPIMELRIGPGISFDLFHLLPTTLMKSALDQILVSNKSPDSVVYELVALSVISLLYYISGYFFYQRFFFSMSNKDSK